MMRTLSARVSTLMLLGCCIIISILHDSSSMSMLSFDSTILRNRLISSFSVGSSSSSSPSWTITGRAGRSTGPTTVTRLCGMLDDMIDISPSNNGTLYKRVVRKGDMRRGSRLPLRKDSVDVKWKIFREDGSLIHDSSLASDDDSDDVGADGTASPSVFNFQVCAEPRQVIRGWDVAILTMAEGEVARLIIHPELAFGELGAPPLIPPNATLLCDLELVKIFPSPSRKFKTVRPDESIRADLMRQIESGESPIARPVVHKQSPSSARNETGTEAKYFNPEVHKVDPRLQVIGEAANYSWQEDYRTMEVRLVLPSGLTKADLTVDISATAISVSLRGGEVLLAGPLHGKVDPAEASWALLSDDDYWPREGEADDARTRYSSSDGRMALQVLLEKSFGSQEIWATLLNRDYLKAVAADRTSTRGGS